MRAAESRGIDKKHTHQNISKSRQFPSTPYHDGGKWRGSEWVVFGAGGPFGARLDRTAGPTGANIANLGPGI
ncbi:hypothetical protein EVAR_10688_1 [Eumeta japonica]|uniref:Uncharacterized protein n=1 Tax=Eumeta variegata TaxID=151549 RepID=A0A4C1U7C0_EUMVA|nr:hypothetical protein EVAR_10688_1 [Eumeta japonica]